MVKENEEKRVVGLGENFSLTEDIELNSVFGETRVMEKGTVFTVCKDHIVFRDGSILNMPSDFKVEGYSVKGIGHMILQGLKRNVSDFKEYLDDYEVDEKEVLEVIYNTLEELGMYNHKGNRG